MKILKITCSVIISILCLKSNLIAQCTIDNSCAGDYANVVVGETSGDSSQSDGCEDAIVEIIGPPGTNIGCMVITDTEWAVLIPAGTTIPADGVFMIGCSASTTQNCGVGNPGQSGLIGGTTTAGEGGGNEGDWNIGLLAEIDFDTCDPNNAAYYDPAATGFTLDNPGSQGLNGDGEQVFLFLPDGTPWDGIYWDSGGTGAADHASVTLGNAASGFVPTSYTLGDNDGNGVVNDNAGTVGGGRGDQGNATAVPILPTGDGTECPCNTAAAPGTFTVPPVTDPIWFQFTTSDHVGCNSSFIRGPLAGNGSGGNPSHTDGLITSTTVDASGQPTDNGGGLATGTTGDAFNASGFTPSSCGDPSAEWGYTDHPTPGQPNNDPAFVFYADVTTVCDINDPITFTVEIYNWQQVSDGSIDSGIGSSSGAANGETGSLVNVNGVIQNWDTYAIAGEQTTMTVTLSGWNPGTNTVGLAWDDWSNTNGTSGNPTTQSNPNECYEEIVFDIIAAEPLMATDAAIDCDAGDSPPGTVNVNNFITGGGNNSFTLTDDAGINAPMTNTSGVFLLPTDMAAGPYTVTVTDGTGCSTPVVLTIADNCELPPVCPSDLDNTGTTADGTFCPGDVIELCLNGTDLPAGGTICWYGTEDGSDPITEDAATATATIGATATQLGCVDIPQPVGGTPSGGPVINEVFADTNNNDGNGGEFIEIAGTPGTVLDCYILTDGDDEIVLPPGTVIPADGYLVIADATLVDGNGPDVDVDLGTCGCFSDVTGTDADLEFTNGSEFVFLYDPAGTYVDGLFWGNATNTNSPNGNGSETIGVSVSGCTPPASVTTSGQTPGTVGTSSGGDSYQLITDVTGTWTSAEPTMGAPNDPQPPVGPECFMYTLPDLCAQSPATITIEPLIVPIDPNCVGADFNYVGATSTYIIDCPSAEIMAGNYNVCEADQASIDLPITVTGGTGPNYDIEYSINGATPTMASITNGGTINIPGPTAGPVVVTLLSIVDAGGAMCSGAVSDAEIMVNISPALDLTITGSSQPASCMPCDGEVTFDLSTGTSATAFDIEYTIDGVSFSVSSVSMPYTLTGACPGTYEIVSALDDAACPMTVTPNEQVLDAPAGMPLTADPLPPVCGDGSVSINLTTDVTYNPTFTMADFNFFTVDPNTLPAAALGSTPPLLASTTVVADVNNSPQDVFVQYTDANGCASVAIVTIDASASCCEEVEPSFTCQNIPLCGGDFALGAVDLQGNVTDGTWGGTAASLVDTQGTADVSDDILIADAAVANVPLTLTLTMVGGVTGCPDVVFSCDFMITTDCDANAGQF